MKTPWHLWVVGGATLLWNAGGAVDYVMTQSRSEAYLAMMTEVQRAYLDSFPAWAVAFWALGVWGAVLGSFLLLLRSRIAVWAFAVSLLGVVVTGLYGEVVAEPRGSEVMGTGQLWFSLVILLSLIAMLAYAVRMTRVGVLR